jgi:acyl-CoA synthetase (AMP-forming)/AMP-acid ligase II
MTAPLQTSRSLLWDLLSIPAAIDPDRPILTFGARTITLAELEAESQAIAARLEAGALAYLGVNSDFALALLFACFASGTTFVPLNYRLTDREIHGILTRHRLDTLVLADRYRHVAAAIRVAGWEGRIVTAEQIDGRGGDAAGTPPGPREGSSASAIVLFTSGTASTPKPISLDGDSLASHIIASTPACNANTREESLLMSMPMYHVAGVVAVLRSVFAGRRVVVVEQFDAEQWVETVEREGVSTAFLVPTMLERVLEVPGLAGRSFEALRTITYGGGPMPAATIRRALAAFGPHVGFVGTYGLTEAGGTVCILDEQDHTLARAGNAVALERLASVGRPLSDVQIAVRDPDGATLAPGEPGEILLRSPRAGSDVVGDDGWLATGDRGYQCHDGYVYFLGRIDDMIVRGGENVSPAEIEEVLRGADGVRDCSVFGVRDEYWGQRIVAAVVPSEAATPPDAAVLTAHCRAALASYKCPDAVVFLDQLPTSPTGKVLKRELVSTAEARLAKPGDRIWRKD